MLISAIIVGLLLLRIYFTYQRYRQPSRPPQQPGEFSEQRPEGLDEAI